MSSTHKTEILQLNQWELDNYPKMEDFNQDNKNLEDFANGVREKFDETDKQIIELSVRNGTNHETLTGNKQLVIEDRVNQVFEASKSVWVFLPQNVPEGWEVFISSEGERIIYVSWYPESEKFNGYKLLNNGERIRFCFSNGKWNFKRDISIDENGFTAGINVNNINSICVGNTVEAINGIALGNEAICNNAITIGAGTIANNAISIGNEATGLNMGVAIGKGAFSDTGVALGTNSAVPAGFGNGAAFGINSEVMRYGQQVHNITGEPSGKLHHSFVYYTGTTNNTNIATNSKEIFLNGVDGKRFTVPLDRNFAFSMVMQMLAFNLDRSNSDMIWKIYNVSATVYNGALQVFSNSSNLLAQSTFLTTANTGLEIKADASNSSIKIGAYGGTADQPLTWLVKGDVIEFRGDKRGG